MILTLFTGDAPQGWEKLFRDVYSDSLSIFNNDSKDIADDIKDIAGYISCIVPEISNSFQRLNLGTKAHLIISYVLL